MLLSVGNKVLHNTRKVKMSKEIGWACSTFSYIFKSNTSFYAWVDVSLKLSNLFGIHIVLHPNRFTKQASKFMSSYQLVNPTSNIFDKNINWNLTAWLPKNCSISPIIPLPSWMFSSHSFFRLVSTWVEHSVRAYWFWLNHIGENCFDAKDVFLVLSNVSFIQAFFHFERFSSSSRWETGLGNPFKGSWNW